MSFLRKLFGSGGSSGDDGMYFYVRCSACNEPIRIRANPSTDLSPVYDESSPGDDPTGYELHKEILGTRCYRLIRAEWLFDRRKRRVGAEIQGGAEITADEYAAESAPQP